MHQTHDPSQHKTTDVQMRGIESERKEREEERGRGRGREGERESR